MRLDTKVRVHHSVGIGEAGLFRNQRTSCFLTVSFLLIVRHFLLPPTRGKERETESEKLSDDRVEREKGREKKTDDKVNEN